MRNDDRLRHMPEPQKPQGGRAARAEAKPDRMVVLIHPIPFGHIREVADREARFLPRARGGAQNPQRPLHPRIQRDDGAHRVLWRNG